MILLLMKSGFIALFHYPRSYESLRESNEWYNINLPSFLRTSPFSSARRTSTKLDVRLDESSLSAPGLSEDTGNPNDIADVQYLLKIRRQDRSCLFPLLSPLYLSSREGVNNSISETRSLAMRDTSSEGIESATSFFGES